MLPKENLPLLADDNSAGLCQVLDDFYRVPFPSFNVDLSSIAFFLLFLFGSIARCSLLITAVRHLKAPLIGTFSGSVYDHQPTTYYDVSVLFKLNRDW